LNLKDTKRPYIRGELRYWFTGFVWDVCGTLTFKPDTTKRRRETLVALLLNKLNRRLYGNKARDKGRKCESIIFEENNSLGTHFHYHMAFIIPKNYRGNIFDFCKLLIRLWSKICGRNKVSEFKPIDDSLGWICYITKQTGNDNCDNLNLHYSHLT
jgi:hypothetical protein